VARALGVDSSAGRAALAIFNDSSNEPIDDPRTDDGANLVGRLDVAMKSHIERALAATRGRIEGRGGAADLLGINPHTLRARMRKLGVDWSRFRLR
jgi:transcriptional regulator with GAF, ATPase, and Fis domain